MLPCLWHAFLIFVPVMSARAYPVYLLMLRSIASSGLNQLFTAPDYDLTVYELLAVVYFNYPDASTTMEQRLGHFREYASRVRLEHHGLALNPPTFSVYNFYKDQQLLKEFADFIGRRRAVPKEVKNHDALMNKRETARSRHHILQGLFLQSITFDQSFNNAAMSQLIRDILLERQSPFEELQAVQCLRLKWMASYRAFLGINNAFLHMDRSHLLKSMCSSGRPIVPLCDDEFSELCEKRNLISGAALLEQAVLGSISSKEHLKFVKMMLSRFPSFTIVFLFYYPALLFIYDHYFVKFCRLSRRRFSGNINGGADNSLIYSFALMLFFLKAKRLQSSLQTMALLSKNGTCSSQPAPSHTERDLLLMLMRDCPLKFLVLNIRCFLDVNISVLDKDSQTVIFQLISDTIAVESKFLGNPTCETVLKREIEKMKDIFSDLNSYRYVGHLFYFAETFKEHNCINFLLHLINLMKG